MVGRRLLYLASLAMAAMLVFAPAALAQQAQPGNAACAELATGNAEASQQQAQAFLDENPSDPNNYDADGDGVACEYTTPSQGSAIFEDGSRFLEGAGAAPSDEGAGGDQYGNGGGNTGGGGEVSGGTLPDTGGAALFALAGGALLVGGGLLVRRITS